MIYTLIWRFIPLGDLHPYTSQLDNLVGFLGTIFVELVGILINHLPPYLVSLDSDYSASCRLGKAQPNHKASATTWESYT
jgi:hypothetical protein